ncbi:MAG: DUF3793 family protein, partial [Turicibacter sp.]
MIEFIINYCAPTLAHIKVANLFSYPLTSLETLKEELRAVNEQINPSGIYATLLKIGKKRALIYVYEKEALESELRNLKVKEFLKPIGYPSINLKECLNFLKKRLMLSEEFPHEIGFFLGYPYEDVIGFIEHQGKDYVYKGYWKVYANVEEMKNLFQKYADCKQYYLKQYGEGISLQRLCDKIID